MLSKYKLQGTEYAPIVFEFARVEGRRAWLPALSYTPLQLSKHVCKYPDRVSLKVKKRKKSDLDRAGQTLQGQTVAKGVFALKETHGVPLEMTLQHFKEHGLVVDWIDYVSTALKAGSNPGSVRTSILTAYGDVHGMAEREKFQAQLDKHCPQLVAGGKHT